MGPTSVIFRAASESIKAKSKGRHTKRAYGGFFLLAKMDQTTS